MRQCECQGGSKSVVAHATGEAIVAESGRPTAGTCAGRDRRAPEVRRVRRSFRFTRKFDAEKSPFDVLPCAARRPTDGHFKTRTERIADLTMAVPSGTTVLSRWFTEAQMHRDAVLDAPWGVMFVRIDVTGEVTASLEVLWEVPGAASDYSYDTVSLTANVISRIVAWEGPVPARVGYRLTLINSGPATRVGVLLDLVAKRPGMKFPTAAWLRDMPEVTHEDAVLPRLIPRVERANVPKPVGCRPAGDEAEGAPEGAEPVDVDTGRPDELYEPFCTPAESAQDWRDSRADSWENPEESDKPRYVVPDPEVVRALEVLGAMLELRPPGNEVDSIIAFPPYSMIGVLSGTPYYKFLGRCEGFDELWAEVTQGLEPGPAQPRLCLLGLNDILSAAGSRYGGNGIELSQLIEVTSTDSDRFWRWKGTAPWFEEPLAWFLVQLVNLISETRGLLPDMIKSPRKRGTQSVAFPDQIFSRIDGRWEEGARPLWRLTVVNFDLFNDHVREFDVEKCEWDSWTGDSDWEGLLDGVDDELDARGQTTREFDPLTSSNFASIYVQGEYVVPDMYGAAQTYELARLFTMLAARYQFELSKEQWLNPVTGAEVFPGLDAYEGTLKLASLYYRAYLACVLRTGKTLVHELFHTTNRRGLTWLGNVLHTYGVTDHCKSGCAHEKMSSAWLMRVAREYRAGWLQDQEDGHTGEITFPTAVSMGSTCANEDTERNGIEFYGKGGDVDLEWEIQAYGNIGGGVRWWAEVERGAEYDDKQKGIKNRFEPKIDRLLSKAERLRRSADLEHVRAERAETRVGRAYHRAREAMLDDRARRASGKALDETQDMLRELRELEERTASDFAENCWDPSRHTTCDSGGAC